MNWNPSETNRVGQLLGAGFASAGQSLADGIREHSAKVAEQKGYQTILKALAEDPTSGVSKEAIDKMDLPTAKNTILASEIRRQRAARQQQAAGRAGLIGAVSAAAGQPGMEMDDSLGGNAAPAGMGGGFPLRRAAPTPAQKFVAALQNNPAILDTDEGKDALVTITKNFFAQKQMPQKINIDGTPVIVNPNTGTFQQVRPAAGGTGSKAMTVQDKEKWPEIDYDKEAWMQDTTLDGKPIPGRYISVDKTTKKPTGKTATNMMTQPRQRGTGGQPGQPETYGPPRPTGGGGKGSLADKAKQDPAGQPPAFANETAARAAGHRGGDIVFLDGIGKVKLHAD